MQAADNAKILKFTRTRQSNRMSLRDRSDAHEWAERSWNAGYGRIAMEFNAPSDEPHLADFVLIYGHGAKWANWGVGCCDGGFIVWRPSTGATLSWHPTIRRALATIPPAGVAEPITTAPTTIAQCRPIR